MELNGLAGGIYKVSEKITKFFYVNCLWILFTLLGGIILGFFPATLAMHTVMRKIIDGKDPAIFQTFKHAYFEDFKKVNIIGIILMFAIYMLYIDFQYVMLMESSIISLALYAGLITVSMLVAIIFMYVFPLLAQHQLTIFQNLKYSCLIGISKPFSTLMMGATLFLCTTSIPQLPFIVLFYGSIISFFWMWFAKKSINQIVQKTNFNISAT